MLNTIFGVLSVFIWFIFTGGEDPANTSNKMAELHLIALIYESGIHRLNDNAQLWTILAYCMLLFSGFISMVSRSNIVF